MKVRVPHIVAAAAVVTAAIVGTTVVPQIVVKHRVDQALATLPEGTKASYQTLSYSLFTRKLTLGGVEMSAQNGDETVVTKLSGLTLRDIDDKHVGELRGAGLTVEDTRRSWRLDAETVGADSMEAPQGLIGGMAGTPAALNLKRLALAGVSLAVEQERVNLREIVVADYVQTEQMPRAMTLGIHGLQVEPESLPDQESRDGLAKLGYDKLSLNFDLAYDLAPEAKRLTIKQASFGGDNVGQVSLAVALGGVDAAALADPAQAEGAVMTATLESLELRYDDSSLAGRVLKLAAAETGLDEAQFKSGLAEQVDQARQAAASPLADEVAAAATSFINAPKSLSLRMKPAKPLSMLEIMSGAQDPVALAQLVGLTVRANAQ